MGGDIAKTVRLTSRIPAGLVYLVRQVEQVELRFVDVAAHLESAHYTVKRKVVRVALAGNDIRIG